MLPKELNQKIINTLELVDDSCKFDATVIVPFDQILNELEAFLNKGGDPHEVYKQLFIENKLKINLGLSLAVCKDNKYVLKYLNLLNTLLERGVTVLQMKDLLFFSARGQHFGMVLAMEHKTEVLKKYFELLNTLLVNGLHAEQLFKIINARMGNISLQTKVLHFQENSIIAANFNLLETLIKKGISNLVIKEMLSYGDQDTQAQFIKYLNEDLARLYRYIRLDILPDYVYPRIKNLKEKIYYDVILKTSRSDILDACMQVEDEKTPLHLLMKQQRGWLKMRPNKGMFKVCSQMRDTILADMEKEQRSKRRVPAITSTPSTSTVKNPDTSFKLQPIPVPAADDLYLVPRLYPYQYIDKTGALQWFVPAGQSVPPPSFCSEATPEPQSLPPAKPIVSVPEGPLINFAEAEKPRAQEPPASAILYAGLFPPVPKEDPVAATAEREKQQKAKEPPSRTPSYA